MIMEKNMRLLKNSYNCKIWPKIISEKYYMTCQIWIYSLQFRLPARKNCPSYWMEFLLEFFYHWWVEVTSKKNKGGIKSKLSVKGLFWVKSLVVRTLFFLFPRWHQDIKGSLCLLVMGKEPPRLHTIFWVSFGL